MIVDFVRDHLAGLEKRADVSRLFGCKPGTVSAGELSQLIEGRDGSDSVTATPSGDGVKVFTPGKFFIR